MKQQSTQSLLFVLLLIILYITKITSCPMECDCIVVGSSLRVSCTNRGLTSLPPDLDMHNINWLDLSGNAFTEIPSDLNQIESLERLILNNNLITELPSNALEGFDSLQTLQLKRNNISNWAAIHPNELLTYAPNLKDLYLNENHFTSLSDTDETILLVSPTLESLHLPKCKISRLGSTSTLSALPKLLLLNLENNPLQQIPELMSESLTKLDLSNTGLGQLNPDIFKQFPELLIVDLSRNHRISLISKTGIVSSASLQEINLSYCNMNEIELNGFEELTVVSLKQNMIRQLDKESFGANSKLANIDLSYNAISVMASDTFKNLKNLKYIDLSYNMIMRVERDTFRMNELLGNINLSRNYISRFNKFYAKTLTNLNMSGCEILNIDSDAFRGFPDLSELDLSNNLISVFPEALSSESLQTLDLSMCR